MTREEAVERIEKMIAYMNSLGADEEEQKDTEALEMAIEALKELDLLEQSHKMFQNMFEVANEKKGEKNNDND